MAVILMIDDDREVLEINKKYLTGEGFDVSIASSAEQGSVWQSNVLRIVFCWML